MKLARPLVGWVLVLMWAACNSAPVSKKASFGRDVVASAYGEALTWDSLAQRIPNDLSLEDSAAFAERVIDRWMREHVMLAQAKANLERERDHLEQALEAYRRSLLINTYETRYVESRLDATLTDKEIQDYYDAQEELFTLHDHAVRVLYVHLPDPQAEAQIKSEAPPGPSETNALGRQRSSNLPSGWSG